MASLLPAIGTFIRPVGVSGYRFSIKVCHVFPDHGRVQGERWGMQDKRPIDDGHRSHGNCFDLVPVAPGVWKDAGDGDWYDKKYWVAVPGDERGQLDMFAAEAGRE